MYQQARKRQNADGKIKDLKRRRDLSWSWVGRLSIVKMSSLPKLIYRFTTFLSKSQQASF